MLRARRLGTFAAQAKILVPTFVAINLPNKLPGRYGATRLRETDVTVAAASFLSLRGRVACTLLELAEHFGEDVGSGRIVIHQKIRQSDLAALAGIARETVNRILNDWKRHKLVSHLSGYYCLENKAQLERQAQR
jgi:hypothetical protein